MAQRMDPSDLDKVLEVDGFVEERWDQVGARSGQIDRTDLCEPAIPAEIKHPTELAEVDGFDRLTSHGAGRVAPGGETPTDGDLRGHGQALTVATAMGGDVTCGERPLTAAHAQHLIDQDSPIFGGRHAVPLGECREIADCVGREHRPSRSIVRSHQ